jgi:hypothetical protein
MESGATMLFHSIVIGIVLFVFMKFILGQRQIVAENRSIVISAFALIYMIMFGHGLPRQLNRDL